ncbi:11942_t:CDS:10, partial [Acaulospora morrowiae]
DYVRLLEEILSSEKVTAIRFFKKAEFTFSQKENAEKALFETLGIIKSKDGAHSVKAARLLHNFDNFINSFAVQQYWNDLKVIAEKTVTNTAQIILQEKEEQNACQIRTNVLEKKTNLLTKRKGICDFEEKRVTKRMQKEQDVDKLIFGDKSDADPNDEVDFDGNKIFGMDSDIVLEDSDADDNMIFRDYGEYCEEEEITVENTSTDPTTKWILSSGRDVNAILSKYREKIPRSKAYLYPAYFGILDLSGEDIEVKNLFTDDEWNEMVEDFKSNVNLSDLEPEQDEPLYKLMDKITEVLATNPYDLITSIESCNKKMNAIRRLIQTYAYNLQRLQLPMSDVAFGSDFTNMVTKGILTFDQIYRYEEGEIQCLASSVISNLKTKPTGRSLIRQKVDFRISKDQFEMLIGLRSGGLPLATKGKKWMDKVDLAVSLRDVLVNEGIENNGIEPSKFQKLFVLGALSYDYNYNIYGLDWKCKGVWRLGLLQKVKLPTSVAILPAIEKLIVYLLRVEETLHRIQEIRYKMVIEKSRLDRSRRTSLRSMDYCICDQGR